MEAQEVPPYDSIKLANHQIMLFLDYIQFFLFQIRWVLDQEAVGGAIVGVRFGYKEHVADNRKTFSFILDDDDLAAINAVQSKSRDLYTVYGDCGQEYRNRG